MKPFISRLCIISGILFFFLAGLVYGEKTLPRRLNFAGSPPQVQACLVHTAFPSQLVIPSIQVNLPIVQSSIKQGEYETTNNGISYLLGTPIPGEAGNSILYGHNFTSILGNLPRIKPGAEIDIYFADKTRKKFIVSYTSEVTPYQTDILKQSEDKRITLYTCSGFLDTKRFVVIATLIAG